MTDINTLIRWAVDQERERCAKIAEAEAAELAEQDDGIDRRDFMRGDSTESQATAERIAAAIRKGDS